MVILMGPSDEGMLTVEVPDQPPTLICLPALSGSVIPAEQNTSVFKPRIVRQALLKSLAKEGSSSKAPVELSGPVPCFSMNCTLPLTPNVVRSGTTTPGTKNLYWPASFPEA